MHRYICPASRRLTYGSEGTNPDDGWLLELRWTDDDELELCTLLEDSGSSSSSYEGRKARSKRSGQMKGNTRTELVAVSLASINIELSIDWLINIINKFIHHIFHKRRSILISTKRWYRIIVHLYECGTHIYAGDSRSLASWTQGMHACWHVYCIHDRSPSFAV